MAHHSSRLAAGGVTLCLMLGATGAAQGQSGGQGSWIPKAALDMARNEVVAAAANGKIYVLGGNTREKYDLTLNDEYDPAAGKWRSRAPIPSGANHMGAVSLNGKIYAVGGFTAPGHRGATTNVFEYDPPADRWRAVAPLPIERGSIAVTALNGKIHAIGGRNDREMTALHHIYDPAADNWITAAPLSRGRDHMVAQAVNGKIHVIGGRWGASTEKTDTHEIYDPATNSWSFGPPLPTPRSGIAGVVYRDMIFVIGGESWLGRTDLCRKRSLRFEEQQVDDAGAHAGGSPCLRTALVDSTLYVIAGAHGSGGTRHDARHDRFHTALRTKERAVSRALLFGTEIYCFGLGAGLSSGPSFPRAQAD